MTIPNQGEKHFEGLLGLYLRQRQSEKSSNTNQSHLDEDTLSAFVEGALTERQATPILRHLIDCVFCRRVTAQLAELNETLDNIPANTNAAKTNSWSELWSNLTENISRPFNDVVLAHEEERDLDKDSEDEPSGK